MPRILRTRAARSDYDEIWSYLAVRDLTAADRLIDQFDATLESIAATPRIGRKVEELAPNLRSFPVGHYFRPSLRGAAARQPEITFGNRFNRGGLRLDIG